MDVTFVVVYIHNVHVGNGIRRIKFLEEIVSSKKLSFPTEEFKFVCEVMKSFVPWLVYLIFPKIEVEKLFYDQLPDIIVHSYKINIF